jgi:hypothetical protein
LRPTITTYRVISGGLAVTPIETGTNSKGFGVFLAATLTITEADTGFNSPATDGCVFLSVSSPPITPYPFFYLNFKFLIWLPYKYS